MADDRHIARAVDEARRRGPVRRAKKPKRFRSEEIVVQTFALVFGERDMQRQIPAEIDGRTVYFDVGNAQWRVEADGVQHLRYTPYFHRRGHVDLERQANTDRAKEEYCARHGLHFLRIRTYDPRHPHTTMPSAELRRLCERRMRRAKRRAHKNHNVE